MKKKIILLLLSIFTLIACTSGTDEQSSEANSDKVLDDRIFEEATGSNNAERCKEISNQKLQDECAMVVNNFLITKEAVDKLDKSLCEQIEDERYRENCGNSIAAAIADKEAQEKAQEKAIEENEEISEIGAKAMEKGDASICDTIEDENQKYSCRYNVITNQAVSAQDPTLCESIGEESSIEQCRNNVERSNSENL